MVSPKKPTRTMKRFLQFPHQLLITCFILSTTAVYSFQPQSHSTTPTSKSTSTTTTTIRTSPLTPYQRIPHTQHYSTTKERDPLVFTPGDNEMFISEVCQGINTVMKKTVVEPVRKYVEIREGGTAGKGILEKLTAPPEVPGIPRPVELTILGSVPTLLGWYGYYKFSVEEELFQHELRTTGRVSGCGGYGTLLPFVWAIIIGYPLTFLGLEELGGFIVQAGVVWILAGQINLYRRVNELWSDLGDETSEKGQGSAALSMGNPPLHAWWALLPPPLDVVVGLRQVHYLSEYWRITRGEEYEKDKVAEELFPFISADRFTLKEFFRTPSMWFWFTKDWEDFDYDFLKDNE